MRRRNIIVVALAATFTIGLTVAFVMHQQQNTPPEDVPRGTSREFRISDVQNHASATDCWVTFGAQVYDISRFIVNLSPEQSNDLTKLCGSNLDTIPSVIKTAEKLSQYQIGILVP